MAGRPVILLDDGGVMNDNRIRGEQWPPLVGEFFAPRLGGTEHAWAEANRIAIQHILEPTNWLQRIEASRDYASFEYTYWLDWLTQMGQLVRVSLPSEQECVQLAQQAEQYIIPRVRSAFPGACKAIQQLYAEGYTLHTASGESSTHLGHYLESMDVRHCFGRLYGPNLINTFKESPEYYRNLFADLQIAPEAALVVDDNPRMLARARALGANTVLVSAGERADDALIQIKSLSQLPDLLQQKNRT